MSPLVWLAAGLLVASAALAQQGGFEVRNAGATLRDNVYYLSARIEYRLSEEAQDALQNGVALMFQLQVELSEDRRWLPDAEVATLRQEYQLSWQPLSRAYVVRNVNSGDQQAYSTLYGALNGLGRVSALPLIDAGLLDPAARYEVALRAVLDQQDLPGPLRLLAFLSGGFTLESEWYRWNLRG